VLAKAISIYLRLIHVTGIGQAIAVSLAASGASVAILDINLHSLNDTKHKVEEAAPSVKCLGYGCDVTDEERVKEVFASVEKDIGPIEYARDEN
jgi:NAD(P)-dependent dehydrogenase (short-subunit alcohol dehydrogenase family)